ncbi:pectate lyase superfamily protein-domain-containing protein [Mycena haematopus]|nr:pectate lyase superfamily protein-domain-containing protein [Mycena haematopus]
MRTIPSLLAFLACASRVAALGSSCSAPLGSGSAAAGDPYWMKTITRQGSSPFNPNAGSYKVFRDVTAAPYNAKGDGTTDDTDAINRAISDQGRCGNLTCQSSSVEPALVYFPSGKYLVTKPITPYYYTALVGDFKNPPHLIARGDFVGIAIIDADVYSGASVPAGGWNCPSSDNEWYCPVNNFFRSIRNFVIDTTNIPANQYGTGIHWQVGQATSLINLSFLLSTASGNQHQGVFMENGSGSLFTIQNVKITNSDTAIYQQWNWGFTFKNIVISGCRIGFGLNTNGQTEATQSTGSVTILDSSISASVAAVQTNTDQSQKLGGAILLQNVNLNGSPVGVVDGANHVFLAGGGTVNQFILGNEYSGEFFRDSSSNKYNTAANPGPDLPSQLLDASSGNNGVFFRTRPQYGNYAVSEFASAKSNGVKCDGTTDDTANLQNFINTFWGCKILYLDAGTCLVSSTITIPTGSIVVGEFWTTILGSGSAFNDASNPQPVVRVGKAGDNGGSAGAVCIEWNPTGDAGTVGMWDVHVRIGGAIGTKIQVSQCPTTSTATQCMGASSGCTSLDLGTLRLNVWVWTADHDLDDPAQGRINSFTARGILIDHAPGPVSLLWLVGTASEHAVFYQYSIVGSQYVYAGMIQTETPYYQPTPAPPAPFSTNSAWNDPSWGNSGSAWALTISQSSDVFIYGAGLYSFFVSYSQDCKDSVDCQKSLVLVDEDSAAIFIYQLSTIGATTMLTVGSTDVINHSDNVDGLQSTVSKWAASKTTPNQPSGTPVGCAALQTQAVAAMKLLFSADGGWYDRGVCGHWPEVNTFETLYNTMWQTGVTTASDLIEIQAIVPNEAHGSSNQLPVTQGYNAAWAGLMYLKVQQYNDAHGISESGNLPDPFYYHEALAIQQGLAQTWLASSGCGGGVPQMTGGTAPNTITTHLYFSLTAADWYTNGKGTTLRNAAGLWYDGQSSTCDGPNGNLWTYNQGPILSGMGAMATLTGNQNYIDFALTTVDAVVNVGTASGPLPQAAGADKHMEVVDGILAEGCDGADASAPSICNHDQQYFKGAFMKHLQYFLDNANNTIRDKYAAFVGAQASAVIHFGTRSDGEIGEVWFAPDTGGSTYNYKTLTAGLDALNCAQKYAVC